MTQNGQGNYQIWRNGSLIAWQDATIHVMSHVIHYGSGIFEGVRSYETPDGAAIFRLRDHMRRLLESFKIYRMAIPYSIDELCDACVETVAANALRSAYLRPLVIRSGDSFGVVNGDAPLETFIIARPAGTYLGEDGFRNGVDVCVSSWRRAAPNTFPWQAKASGNYLNAQLALMEAKQNGYAEGIMLDSFGFVSEGSGENLFIVRDGVLITTPLSAAILHGITRDTIMILARERGLTVREENVPREALYTADELFFTGTAAEVTPIRSVDGVDIANGKPGPITLALQDEFMSIVQGRTADRHGWCTPVVERAAVPV
jgi:branched-chain amino acid aminotransferase